MSAESLKLAIEKITAETGCEKVDLVCHSMGGLVASAYYASYASEERVGKIITCGTPYEGAPTLINSVMNWDVLGQGFDITSWDAAKSSFGDLILGSFGGLTKKLKASFAGVAELTPTVQYADRIAMQRDASDGYQTLTADEYRDACREIFGDLYDEALAFQDSNLGRGWFCSQRKPGYEDVRCSGLLFFEKSLNTYREWQLEQGKVKVDPRVKDAVVNDSPAKLRILLDLEGKSLGVRLFNIILLHRKPNMLWFLMENDNLVKEFLDRRRILFYACANLGAADALGLVEKAENLQPGIAAACIDAFGRNLLWYTLYSDNWRDKTLADALVKYGCDPDAETAWNLSWRDMAAQ